MCASVCKYCDAMLSFLDVNTLVILFNTPGWFLWMCKYLCLFKFGVNATSTKFVAPIVVPTSQYLTNFSETSRAMFACASEVLPPMCGVRITFGNFCRTFLNASLLNLVRWEKHLLPHRLNDYSQETFQAHQL